MTVPVNVTTPFGDDVFIPGAGLPTITRTPQKITDQTTLNLVIAAALRAGFSLELSPPVASTAIAPSTAVRTVNGTLPDAAGNVNVSGGVGGSVASTDITDSTATGRAVLVASNAAAARTAIGAGTASTAADVGLGSANNTSDASKPVSTAQQTALDAKVTAVAAPAGDPGAPVWKRTLTTALASSWANLQETWVGTLLASWRNEWGALRGTSPYTGSGDALVRAIRTTADTITGSASALEVVDRRGTGSPTMIGFGWDGKLRFGGVSTTNEAGTAAALCVLVNHSAAAPAGLPDGTLIFEKTS